MKQLPDEKFLLCAVLPLAIYLVAGICFGIDALVPVHLFADLAFFATFITPFYSIIAGISGITHAYDKADTEPHTKIHDLSIVLCILHMLISAGIVYFIIHMLFHPPT